MNMRISILPKNALGWWSVGLAVATFLSSWVIVEIWHKYPNVALNNTLNVVVIGIAAAALVTGVISIAKRKQGAILVFVSTAIGLVVMIGGIGALLGLENSF
jgi:uncharacterized membrane protein YozB (DUF420 family)